MHEHTQSLRWGGSGGRSSPEGNLIPLQLHGNYRLWKHRFTWHFYLKEANGQWAPPPTHRITPHCRQAWNSPLEPQQTQEKKVDQRPAYISQLLAVPWRDEWQLEKITLLFRLSQQHLLCKQGDFAPKFDDACLLCTNVQTATMLLLHIKVKANRFLTAALMALSLTLQRTVIGWVQITLTQVKGP